MKTLFVILILIPVVTFSQNLRENARGSLFSDYKADRIGDAITILVVESSQASNNAETSTGRKSDIGLRGSASLGDDQLPKVDFGLGTGNDFRGAGSTKTSGMIRTKISATIDSVLNNGNLFIRGSRKIVINGEEQLVRISGVVRALDIMGDNTVYSYNISEAEIYFDGSGMINNSQKPGWLTRLFHWLF